MLTIVTGGSGSGKSAYAEGLVTDLNGRQRIYIATMIPWDEECQNRIARHRLLRAKKQFITIECYKNLVELTLPDNDDKRPKVVLLECMSNLTANELYDDLQVGKNITNTVMKGVEHLQKQAEDLIIVTNEVFSDGNDYEPETIRYLEILGEINRELGKRADRVVEVVSGIPVVVKTGKCTKAGG